MIRRPASVLRWLELVVVLLAVSGMAGCNLVTGAAGIQIEDEDDSGSDGSGAGGPTGGSGAGDVTSGQGGAGAGTGGAGGNEPPVEQMAAVDGVAITKISLYQAVERPLMENGSPVGALAPVVAGREGLMRVFYAVDGSYDGQPVTARLTIGSAPPVEMQVTPSGTSVDGNLGSTINFDLPPELLTVGATFRVELLQVDASGANGAAVYPAEGQIDLQVEPSGVLKVTLVPVQYDADGSGRLPDTSPAQLQRYEDLFYAMYPIPDIQLSVRNAMSWSNSISANGNGWGNLLNAIADLRASDNAAPDEYYYGIFEPAGSFGAYCSGGCVSGLGFLGGPSDVWARAAIGIGFSGDGSVETAVHELGHNHGREHAPCGGVSGADSSYPYSGAKIGAWGYNLLTGQLYNPDNRVDMMSYCSPSWISDYNYNEIFERVQFASGASIEVPPALQDVTWDRVMVGSDGTLEPMDDIQLPTPPFGEAVDVDVDTSAGTEQVTGRFVKYDHLDGGVIFIPPTSAGSFEPKLIHAHLGGEVLSAMLP